ncbi:MAG: hypothetical protein PHY90_12190 [Desulfitobacteriaceae bacterium]|nr:hypothetical protein [Desulfitobacteriaceae bacterium]
MKGFNKFFVILLAIFLVIILPVADLADEERKGEVEAENLWGQVDFDNALKEAEWRLAQLETEYEEALLTGDLGEINCLLDQIATEKSNINLMERQIKEIMEEEIQQITYVH